MRRRDLLTGAGCLAAVGTGEAMRPRRTLSLMGDATLDRIVPAAFAGWRSRPAEGIVLPKTPGSLADTLYSDTLARTYTHDEAPPVMLLIAHGAAQSDLLQLHRPESCYPAVGFAISRRRFRDIPLGHGAAIPAVALTATAQDRSEDLLYWTRLGEYLPRTAGEQRADRLRTAMQGYVADGVLVRTSTLGIPGTDTLDTLQAFARNLLDAVPPAYRKALVGSQRAQIMQGGGR